VRDLWLRTGLPRSTLERLARADAFRSLGLDRRDALWAVHGLDDTKADGFLPLLDDPRLKLAEREPEMRLPAMPLGEHVIHDYRTLSLSLKAHPVSFLRQRLVAERVVANASLETMRSGARACVCGLVLVRQRPGSAKGVIFMTIEDETGVANIIVWPKVFERFRAIVIGSRLVRVRGRVQSESGVTHLVADTVEDITPRLGELSEEAYLIDSLANADEVRRPVVEQREKATKGSKLAALMEEIPGLREDYEALARRSGAVMPKGRNFH
jgi:error-prone DNA polymerase